MIMEIEYAPEDDLLHGIFRQKVKVAHTVVPGCNVNRYSRSRREIPTRGNLYLEK